MAVITFNPTPATPTLYIKSMRWERYDQDITMRGPFGVQSVATVAPLWKVNVVFDMQDESASGAYQALLMQLDGSRNQLSLYNVGRPTPRGTYAGVGTNTITTGVAGANTITISNGSYTTGTLKAGDYIGVGSGTTTQVVMVTADITAIAGVITPTIYPALRNTVTGGTATLQYPRALFRVQGPVGWDYSTVVVDGMSLDLLEDVRP